MEEGPDGMQMEEWCVRCRVVSCQIGGNTGMAWQCCKCSVSGVRRSQVKVEEKIQFATTDLQQSMDVQNQYVVETGASFVSSHGRAPLLFDAQPFSTCHVVLSDELYCCFPF